MHKGLLTTSQVFAIISAIIMPFIFEDFFIIGFAISAFNVISIVILEYGKKGEVSKRVVVGWGIYLIFTTIISGILTIIAANQDNKSKPMSISNVETRLKEIDDLLHKGMITKEEYEIRRKNILERI